MANTQRLEKVQEAATRTNERGHLALVEWNTDTPPAVARRTMVPVRRTRADRLYEGGIFLLMLASALAALVSFMRL